MHWQKDASALCAYYVQNKNFMNEIRRLNELCSMREELKWIVFKLPCIHHNITIVQF